MTIQGKGAILHGGSGGGAVCVANLHFTPRYLIGHSLSSSNVSMVPGNDP